MKNKGLVFVGIGFEAIGIILSTLWLGQWLDSYLQQKGLFTILFIFIGLGGWFAHILFLVKKMNKE